MSSPASTTLSTAASLTTDTARRAFAASVAKRFLNKVRLPGGAQIESAAPVATVSQRDDGSSVPAYLIADSMRWFIVPGTVDGVIGYVRAHPPVSPPESAGNWSGDGPDGMPYTGVSFFGDTDTTTDTDTDTDIAESRVTVEAAAAGEYVAVKVEAQVTFVPVRSQAEAVPLAVTGAVLVRVGDGAAVVKVQRADAYQLAMLLNALTTQAPIPVACPFMAHTDSVTFAVPGGSMVFDFTCNFGVAVSVNGVNQPGLVSSYPLTKKVDLLFSTASPGSATAPAP